MIATGHDERTAAVVENLKKRHSTHTTEVRAETLPPEVEQLIADMAEQLARMHGELADARQRISAIEAIEIDKRLLKGAA
jgi:transposase